MVAPQPPSSTAVPTLGMAAALERCEPLGRLLRRLDEARSLYEAVAPLLPPALRADVRTGPVDAGCWTLLAAHNPAAAKLRQMLPLLLAQLQAEGRQVTAIRVRVQPRSSASRF